MATDIIVKRKFHLTKMALWAGVLALLKSKVDQALGSPVRGKALKLEEITHPLVASTSGHQKQK